MKILAAAFVRIKLLNMLHHALTPTFARSSALAESRNKFITNGARAHTHAHTRDCLCGVGAERTTTVQKNSNLFNVIMPVLSNKMRDMNADPSIRAAIPIYGI